MISPSAIESSTADPATALENERVPRPHAIALFSGGLDSALAVLLMLRQNVRVTAITFMTHFGCDLSDRSSCSANPYPAAKQFGFEVKLMHLGRKFVDIVQNPKYGYGKNMNPCIDCRLLMLREARDYMEAVGADCVITGEVLGQRPFSQLRDKLQLTQRESGLRDRLLRPLSAKLLAPSLPEELRRIDREQLEAISGRSRHRQMELAREFGLEDYPSPGSGCLLTDPEYSRKLRDLLTHKSPIDFTDLNLLLAGRHFRLGENLKAIVGRSKEDNDKIAAYVCAADVVLEVMNAGSPVTLLRDGDPDDAQLETAARLTARYSSRRNDDSVDVEIRRGGEAQSLRIRPATQDLIEHCRV